MKSKQLHFIVGIWRSGTTLLREILAMNDSVVTFEEHSAVLQTLKYSQKFQSNKSNVLSAVAKNKDFIDFSEPDINLVNSKLNEIKGYEAFAKTLYSSTIQNPNEVSTLIDKNPKYSYFLPDLLDAFPSSKFIWLVREPKDNCVSRMKNNIQSFKNINYLAHWWNLTNLKIAAAAKKYPDRFLMVPYEQLVSEKELWIRKICSFTDIVYKTDMLEFEKGKNKRDLKFHNALLKSGRIKEKEFTLKINHLTENLQKPINSSKIDSWKSALTQEQANIIDSLCQKNYESILRSELENLNDPSSAAVKLLSKLSLSKLKFDIARNKK